ncbi:putative conjugal transfer protein [Pectobacterium sp. F1-1]|nr:putative conjugal transfer protein [Pectobacterium sp. F1-1]
MATAIGMALLSSTNTGINMKSSLIFLMLCVLMGCVQRQHDLTPVSGDPQPVNSPAIIQELTKHV